MTDVSIKDTVKITDTLAAADTAKNTTDIPDTADVPSVAEVGNDSTVTVSTDATVAPGLHHFDEGQVSNQGAEAESVFVYPGTSDGWPFSVGVLELDNDVTEDDGLFLHLYSVWDPDLL